MKIFLTFAASTMVMALASQSAMADSNDRMFRTDRLTVTKPMPQSDVKTIERIRIQRTDRIGFYKRVSKQETQKREQVRRTDRIVFTKTLG